MFVVYIEKIDKIKITWRDWIVSHAQGMHAKAWLAFISFTESIFLPIPTIAFLTPILMVNSRRWVYYAAFTTVFSVIGGIVGYFVGVFFFDLIGMKIINFYNLAEQFASAKEMFNGNAFMVNFIGAFTPLPYKIFTLSSGFLQVNFFAFVSASIIGRGMQFFLAAYLTKLYGPLVSKLIFKYFNIIVILIVAVFVLSLVV